MGLGEIRVARWINDWIKEMGKTERIRIGERGKTAPSAIREMALQRHRVQALDQTEGTREPSWKEVETNS